MTRPRNPDLPNRILEAARAVWHKGGNDGFDVRSIATAADTTVATLYARFSSRDDLLKALRQESLQIFFKAMGRAKNIRSFCEEYLRFAETHPRDYELIFGARWRDRSETGGVNELTQRLENRVADELHCDGATARSLGLQLWLLLHGAASERVTEKKAGSLWTDLKGACLEGCSELAARRRTTGAPHHRANPKLIGDRFIQRPCIAPRRRAASKTPARIDIE